VRRLIINADDLGLTPGVNRAILESSRHGVVTSATLMANSGAFTDAVARVRSLHDRKLSVGCHLVLVDGEPVNPSASVPSLTNRTAEFRRGIGQLAFAARMKKLDPAEVETEAVAQFKKLWSTGLRPSHFDTHKHSHLFPEILEPALRAARTCNIPAVRNPFEPANPLPFSFLARYRKLLKRYFQLRLLRIMRSNWLRRVQEAGLKTPDGSFGVITTGDVDMTLLRALLENMPEGTWELVCHPGYNDADLDKVRTRLRDSRVHELELLTSPNVRKLIDSLGIELISYNEL
jgi:hopanoid biosynthesis associated protein HpnK